MNNLAAWLLAIAGSVVLVLALACGGAFLGMLVFGEPAIQLLELPHRGALLGGLVGAALGIVLLTRYWGRAP